MRKRSASTGSTRSAGSPGSSATRSISGASSRVRSSARREAGFRRTGNRKDFATQPPRDTILDTLTKAGRAIVTVGKIGDIFAHRSTGREIKPHGNDACLSAAIEAMNTLPDGGLVFANLVDFDSEYGHRRDIPGYAAALEAFDRRMPEIRAILREGDLVIITADHGNDPSWHGTDHTREHTPILCFGPERQGRPDRAAQRVSPISARRSLSHLGVPSRGPGRRLALTRAGNQR